MTLAYLVKKPKFVFLWGAQGHTRIMILEEWPGLQYILVITGACTFSAQQRGAWFFAQIENCRVQLLNPQIHLAAILFGDLHLSNYRIWSSNHSPMLLDSLNIYSPFSGKTLSKPFYSKHNPLPFPSLKYLSSDNLVPYFLMSLDFWKKRSPVWK